MEAGGQIHINTPQGSRFHRKRPVRDVLTLTCRWSSSIYRWTGIRGLRSGVGGTGQIKSTVLLRLVGYVRGCIGIGRYDCGLRAR